MLNERRRNTQRKSKYKYTKYNAKQRMKYESKQNSTGHIAMITGMLWVAAQAAYHYDEGGTILANCPWAFGNGTDGLLLKKLLRPFKDWCNRFSSSAVKYKSVDKTRINWTACNTS